MTVADICKTLDLTDDGIGQYVGIASNEVLVAEGINGWRDMKIKILEWNPPEADVLVEGDRWSWTAQELKSQSKKITVDVDKLILTKNIKSNQKTKL